MSYKFQRLRERIRQAVVSGELSGKLPGERALARRFHVNAKTLSKALTDLAAEGLLDRSIGRGTYTKGHAPAVQSAGRWLLICDPTQLDHPIVASLRAAHPELDVITDVASLRPSFLNQFAAVIDLAKSTPDEFLRDLVVRNIPVVLACKEPRTYSTHAVVFDRHRAILQLGRNLLLGGHRRLAAVDAPQSTQIADGLRQCAVRYAPSAQVDGCFPTDVHAMIEAGVTAFLCDSVTSATLVRQQLDQLGIAVPAAVSVLAAGIAETEPPVTGYFLNPADKAKAIVQLLENASPGTRPATLWLTGQYVERGTMSALPNPPNDREIHYDAAG